jgi:hypothetical protein
LIRAFIYEHKFYKNGSIDENGAIGESLIVDLTVFLFGMTTSMAVLTLIIYGETIGLGRFLTIIFCRSTIIY